MLAIKIINCEKKETSKLCRLPYKKPLYYLVNVVKENAIVVDILGVETKCPLKSVRFVKPISDYDTECLLLDDSSVRIFAKKHKDLFLINFIAQIEDAQKTMTKARILFLQVLETSLGKKTIGVIDNVLINSDETTIEKDVRYIHEMLGQRINNSDSCKKMFQILHDLSLDWQTFVKDYAILRRDGNICLVSPKLAKLYEIVCA